MIHALALAAILAVPPDPDVLRVRLAGDVPAPIPPAVAARLAPLGAPTYEARERATRAARDRGWDGLDDLLSGRFHRDAEVRERCEAVLWELIRRDLKCPVCRGVGRKALTTEFHFTFDWQCMHCLGTGWARGKGR